MENKKISINDIAKHLKIAKSTVSLIINGKADERRISKELQAKVLDYVREVRFYPHHLAQSLATGRSSSIGLIVEDISDSFFGPIALMIENLAKAKGYRIMYSSTLGDTNTAVEIINFFRRSQLDGYIIAPTKGIEDVVKEMVNEHIPIVLFDRDPVEGVDFVGTNNKEAMIEACMHLYDKGFRQIGFVTLESTQSQMHERLLGYQETMEKLAIDPKVAFIPFESKKTVKQQLIKDFLEKNLELDAIIFATNYLCLAGLAAINKLTAKRKMDFGIMSFDDHEAFNLISPTITAIRQPLEELSNNIIKLLLKQIEKPTKDNASHVVLPSVIKARKSSERKSNNLLPIGRNN